MTFHTDSGEDIGKGLVSDGLLLVDKKGGRKLANLVKASISRCLGAQ